MPPRNITKTSQKLLPLLQKLKEAYMLWFGYYQTLPKTHRYSLGTRIDGLLVEAIESVSIASFLQKEEKLPWIRLAIRKMDTLKVLLMVLWENKSLDNKKYVLLSGKMEEIGRMLGGWQGQVIKNSPVRQLANSGEK